MGRAALVLACLLCACHGGPHGAGTGDAGATDAGGALDGAVASVVDAGPEDELVPAAASEELTARARHLLEAIAKQDATLAVDILFPRDAWLATRDATDPGKDWEKRVDRPFQRALHVLARRTKGLDRAAAITLELGHTLAQAAPRRHGWKKSLWTVTGSRLTFTIDGRTRTLPIRELVAWRGAWYVTRLR
jgi:hypothetical protein